MTPRCLGTVLVVLLLAVGCGSSTGEPELPELPSPDLTGMEPLVDRVLTDARSAVEADPESAEAWGRLGAAYQAHDLMAEAEVCYGAAKQLAPEEFDWAYLHAVVREQTGGSREEIRQSLDAAAEMRDDYAPIHLRLGRLALGQGDFDPAIAAFERAIRIDGDSAPAHRGLGQARLGAGEDSGAVDALEHAAELAPEDGAAVAALAQAYERVGRQDDSRRAASRAQRLRPVQRFDDPVLEQRVQPMGASSRHWFARAQDRLARGDFAGALEHIAMVEQVRGDDADVLYLKSSALRGVGRPDDSNAALQSALEANPDHVPSLTDSGRALARQGNVEEALIRLDKARALAPDDPEVVAALASARAASGDVAGAAEVFGSLAELLPDDPRVHLNLGSLLARSGKLAEAEESFERAVQLDPSYAEAHRRLGVLLDHQGRAEEAERHRVEAARAEGGSGRN